VEVDVGAFRWSLSFDLPLWRDSEETSVETSPSSQLIQIKNGGCLYE
jgi:hypothetical protein